MKPRARLILSTAAAIGIAGFGVALAQGRGLSAGGGPPSRSPQQQPQRQGQMPPAGEQARTRMQKMDQLRLMTQESARIQTRSQQLAQQCEQDQARVQNGTQLRLMQEMPTTIGAQAREHDRLASRLRDLIQERDRDRDRDRDRLMDRDMDRIQKRLASPVLSAPAERAGVGVMSQSR